MNELLVKTKEFLVTVAEMRAAQKEYRTTGGEYIKRTMVILEKETDFQLKALYSLVKAQYNS